MSGKWWTAAALPPCFCAIDAHEAELLDAPQELVESSAREPAELDDVWPLAVPDIEAVGRVHAWCAAASSASKRAVLQQPGVVDFFVRLLAPAESEEPAAAECLETGCASLALLCGWSNRPCNALMRTDVFDALVKRVLDSPATAGDDCALAAKLWCLAALVRAAEHAGFIKEPNVLIVNVLERLEVLGPGASTAAFALLHGLLQSGVHLLPHVVFCVVHAAHKTACLSVDGAMAPHHLVAGLLLGTVDQQRWGDLRVVSCAWISAMMEASEDETADTRRRACAVFALCFIPSTHKDDLPPSLCKNLLANALLGLIRCRGVRRFAYARLLSVLFQNSPRFRIDEELQGFVVHFMVRPLLNLVLVSAFGDAETSASELLCVQDAALAVLRGCVSRRIRANVDPEAASSLMTILALADLPEAVHQRSLELVLNVLQVTCQTETERGVLEEVCAHARVSQLMQLASLGNPEVRSCAVDLLFHLSLLSDSADRLALFAPWDLFASVCTSSCNLAPQLAKSAFMALSNLARRRPENKAKVRLLVDVQKAAFRFLALSKVHRAARAFLEHVFDMLPSEIEDASSNTMHFVVPFTPATARPCIICFEDNCQEAVFLCCLHSFHLSCLTTWFLTKPTCPLCQSHVAWSYFETAKS